MPDSGMILLDGSMGAFIGNPEKDDDDSLFKKLWSAAALANPEHNDMVVQAHIEYIKAGSKIITTNTYSVNPYLYSKVFGEDMYEELMLKHAKLACYLADDAISKVPSAGGVKIFDGVRIFGVMGPICDTFQPEMFKQYMMEKGPGFCVGFYEKLSQALYEGGVDGILIETMNCWEEAYIALEGVKKMISNVNNQGLDVSLPIIVSLQGCFIDQEFKREELAPITVQEFIKYVDENPKLDIIGFGLNCASPEDLLRSYEIIFETNVHTERTLKGKTVMESAEEAFRRRNIMLCAYPNLFRHKYEDDPFGDFHIDQKDNTFVRKTRQDMLAGDYQGFCDVMEELVNRFQISYIGGCCGSNPCAIKKLDETLLKTKVAYEPVKLNFMM